MGVCYVIEIASKVEINKLKVWHARTQGERKTDQVFVCFLNGVGKQNKSSFSWKGWISLEEEKQAQCN